jgi:hypothetical protein
VTRLLAQWAVLWALLLGLGACGGAAANDASQHGDPPDERAAPRDDNVPSPKQLCTARCERRAACGDTASDCISRCVKNSPATGAIRSGLLWRMLGCIDGMECVFVKQGRAWDACFESGRASLPISKSLRRFCFESSSRAAKCGRSAEADQTACLTRFRHIRDEHLDAALECTKLACDQVPLCFSARVGP